MPGYKINFQLKIRFNICGNGSRLSIRIIPILWIPLWGEPQLVEFLLNFSRLKANGDAQMGKYTGEEGAASAAESLFVAKHAY